MPNTRWPMKWSARWIWSEAPAHAVSPIATAAIPPRETWNRFCYLRRAFDLASVPASVPARVTADSRYILYVNGGEAARGPARSVPERLAWCELDLAPMLKARANAIAAIVRFYGSPMPWWRPAAANLQLGFGSFAFEAPSIAIVSDDSWKAHPAPYQREVPVPAMLPIPPMEIFDAREEPAGWRLADYDDSLWKSATVLSAGTLATNRIVIPVEPYPAPEHDDIAPLTSMPRTLMERERRTIALMTAADPLAAYDPRPSAPGGDLMITFEAEETLATSWIEVHGPRGSIIDVYAGEDLRDDGSVEIKPRHYASRYIVRGDGVERFEGFEAVGMCYLTVVARGGAEVLRAGATERRYPRPDGAYFSCDDHRLNAIWNAGARTLDLCSTDAFVDCPGREQRAWLGDSYIHSLVSFVTSSDWRLVRRHLRICAHSRRADGLLAMCAAGDFSISSTTIPDYSLHWVRALARYYDYSGDAETVRELAPAAIEVLAAFEHHRAADGLIRAMPGWIFIDWAMTQRSEVVGALDALYAAALDDFAGLAESALSDRETAAIMRRRAERTRGAFERLWDGARGAYVDAADARGALRRVSQQTNAAAIIGGCAPRERWDRMLDYVLEPERLAITPTISDNRMAYIAQRMDPAEHTKFDQEIDVVAAQPFFCHFVHDALARAGRRDLIAAQCLRWWPQLERGNTTFEEYWSGPAGEASRCHAWSATPTYDLTAYVLGVRPSAPGYSNAEIRPLFGTLTRLRGHVPTPHGMIEIALDRTHGGLLTIPHGIVAEVSFEDAKLGGGTFAAGTHTIGLRQGAEREAVAVLGACGGGHFPEVRKDGQSRSDRILVGLDELEQLAGDIFSRLVVRFVASVQLFVAFSAGDGVVDRFDSQPRKV